MKEEQLIFIASQPRAGSTYLQNVLSNNAQTNTTSEPWIMLSLAPILKPSLVKQSNYDHRAAVDALQLYQHKCGINMIEHVKQVALNMYVPLAENYELVIDKTPRYWEILDELVSLFPKSKIVVLKRNPLDVVTSMIQTWDIKTLEQLNYFRRDLLEAPKQIDAFLDKHKNNKNIIEVSYNQLINDKVSTVKLLYNQLGLVYNDDVLDTSKNTKYKGKYGDPYQNSQSKPKQSINKVFQKFKIGYANYLGKDYFSKNNFTYQTMKPTMVFDYFINLGAFRDKVGLFNLKRELSLLYKKTIITYFK